MYFDKLAEQRSVINGPGRGRKVLGKEAATQIDSIRQRYPDDFDRLARRLEEIIHEP